MASGANITVNGSLNVHTLDYNGSLTSDGLINYNNKGYVDALSTEAAVSWPADSYSPCYVGQEAASVLGVEPLKVIFKK